MKSALTETFLESRGLDAAALEALDAPTGEPLLRIDELCNAIDGVRRNSRVLTVIPDYDVDGLMSGVILYSGLAACGVDTRLFVPDPRRGYGFDERDVERLLAEFPDTHVAVTCDVGVSCVDGVKALHNRGRDVFVTDHHVEDPLNSTRGLASDGAFVDPCAVDEERTLPGICGAHVALLAVERFAELYAPTASESVAQLAALAGLATVADVMPMLHENRELVRTCAKTMKSVVLDEQSWLASDSEKLNVALDGFTRFVKELSLRDRVTWNGDTYREMGWSVIPLLNAARRLGSLEDMRALFAVFTDPASDVHAVVDRLEELDGERRRIVDDVVSKFDDKDVADKSCFVVDAPGGVLGLVASKLCDRRGKPTVVVTSSPDGKGLYGSMRAPGWYQFIDRTAHLGFYAAGHQQACGVSFDSTARLRELDGFLRDDAIPPDDVVAEWDVLIGDGGAPINGRELRLFLDDVESMKPFGPSFDVPKLAVGVGCGCDAFWKTMGRDGSHLKGAFRNVELVCWGRGDDAERLASYDGPVKVVGELSVNRFRGNETLQVIGELVYD